MWLMRWSTFISIVSTSMPQGHQIEQHLLDENFVAKVADFGLAHASKDGSICFEPVNTDIRGTPGYMDPEYVVTHELTDKSDVYSYGVLLLEIVTARRAVQDGKNLVESSQILMASESRLLELVDPKLRTPLT
ncbi:hypothetical protein ERO13_D12G023950v2 [Gossypium hirsutum]|nr:hypothetical protein ERO13_D12G023950v2 [Gossypium hirsutum]